MRTGGRWFPRLTRVALVVATFAGLLAMHGLGDAAVLGCHHPSTSEPTELVGQAHGHQLCGQNCDDHPAMSHDELCKPLLPWWSHVLPTLPCIALLAWAGLIVVAVAWRPRTRGLPWWRGPPRSGRVCLHRVCVSRT